MSFPTLPRRTHDPVLRTFAASVVLLCLVLSLLLGSLRTGVVTGVVIAVVVAVGVLVISAGSEESSRR